jgi:probable HAF family extracellular repeat protein
MRRKSFLSLLVLLVLFLLAFVFIRSTHPSGPRYTLTDIGTLAGDSSTVCAINELGEVAGKSQSPDGTDHIFFWNQAQGMVDLGTPSQGEIVGVDLNEQGEYLAITSGSPESYYFLRNGTSDKWELAGLLPTPGAPPEIRIESLHKWLNAMEQREARAKETMAAQGINSASEMLTPFAVNQRLDVVGMETEMDAVWKSQFLFKTWSLFERVGLGDAFLTTTGKLGLSSVRMIGMPFSMEAFLCRNGCVWKLKDLVSDAAGWQFEAAMDINDRGMIVGMGNLNGETRAFLLTPINEPLPPPSDNPLKPR